LGYIDDLNARFNDTVIFPDKPEILPMEHFWPNGSRPTFLVDRISSSLLSFIYILMTQNRKEMHPRIERGSEISTRLCIPFTGIFPVGAP
jgi:hypothetical protein